MEFMELLRTRHSVRRYRSEPVAPELVTKILEAVRTAPTAGNFQAYEIYLVRGAERMKAVTATTFNHDWVAEAPAALVVCTHAARCQYDNPEHWATQDASIAATVAHLAIADLGLGSCWVGAFVPTKLAEVLGIPEGQRPLALIPFGYANEVPQPSTRREVEEFVHTRE